MKRLLVSGFVVLVFIFSNAAVITWDGGGDAVSWNDALNWTGDVLPGAGDDVVLDNLNGVPGSYTVNLPVAAVTVIINSLTLTPSGSNSITLNLPASNTANPGLNVTGPGDALLLNSGSILKNSSGASAGSGITITNIFRINNGSRYIHNTGRGNAAIVSQLSIVAGTESGIFEYDVPLASYTISLSGRTYGSLILSSIANGGTITYLGSGASLLNIRGNFLINTGVSFSISMTADFIVHGNYNQSASSTFNIQNSTGNNIVKIMGDITSAGTITKTGTGLPELQLNGTSNQTINITGTITGTVDFNSNNPAGATLLSDLILPYRYKISGGNLTLGIYNLTTPTIIMASLPAANHIITNSTGVLKILNVGAVAVIFPVGRNAASYNPVLIAKGSGTIDFSVRVENTINPPIANPFAAVVLRTWTVNSSLVSATDISITFQFNSGEWNPLFNTFAPAEAGQFINSAWHIIATNLLINGSGIYSVSTGAATSFNTSFIIGNNGAILPLGFYISCHLQKQNDHVIINWKVAQLDEVDHFEVERAVNGSAFQYLGTVVLNGGHTDYSYEDLGAGNGNNLYRIRVILRSGQVKYSNTVSVINSDRQLFITGIVPNPVHHSASFSINSAASREVVWQINDASGKTMKRWQQHLTIGTNLLSISISEMKAGVYFIAGYTPEGRTNITSFVKE